MFTQVLNYELCSAKQMAGFEIIFTQQFKHFQYLSTSYEMRLKQRLKLHNCSQWTTSHIQNINICIYVFVKQGYVSRFCIVMQTQNARISNVEFMRLFECIVILFDHACSLNCYVFLYIYFYTCLPSCIPHLGLEFHCDKCFFQSFPSQCMVFILEWSNWLTCNRKIYSQVKPEPSSSNRLIVHTKQILKYNFKPC